MAKTRLSQYFSRPMADITARGINMATMTIRPRVGLMPRRLTLNIAARFIRSHLRPMPRSDGSLWELVELAGNSCGARRS